MTDKAMVMGVLTKDQIAAGCKYADALDLLQSYYGEVVGKLCVQLGPLGGKEIRPWLEVHYDTLIDAAIEFRGYPTGAIGKYGRFSVKTMKRILAQFDRLPKWWNDPELAGIIGVFSPYGNIPYFFLPWDVVIAQCGHNDQQTDEFDRYFCMLRRSSQKGEDKK